MATDDLIRRLLTPRGRWAVVGLSPRPDRASHDVAAFLQDLGFEIVPVNPTIDEVLGVRAYPDLASIPGRIDVVDIFRREPGPHVDEALAIGASAVWMQLGVIDEAAASRARAAGLQVVMDRCPKIEYRRLHLA
jgi:predicted CoA-binding protein